MKKSTILGYLTPNNSRAARGREHWGHKAPWALRMREREAGAGASAGAGRWARALGRWALGRSVHGARCAGARRSALAVRGARCTVHGARCAVRGARCTVRGARALGARCAGAGRSVRGRWALGRSALGARCAVRGARCARASLALAMLALARASRVLLAAPWARGQGKRPGARAQGAVGGSDARAVVCRSRFREFSWESGQSKGGWSQEGSTKST